jgi:hypothetical protein
MRLVVLCPTPAVENLVKSIILVAISAGQHEVVRDVDSDSVCKNGILERSLYELHG